MRDAAGEALAGKSDELDANRAAGPAEPDVGLGNVRTGPQHAQIGHGHQGSVSVVAKLARDYVDGQDFSRNRRSNQHLLSESSGFQTEDPEPSHSLFARGL